MFFCKKKNPLLKVTQYLPKIMHDFPFTGIGLDCNFGWGPHNTNPSSRIVPSKSDGWRRERKFGGPQIVTLIKRFQKLPKIKSYTSTSPCYTQNQMICWNLSTLIDNWTITYLIISLSISLHNSAPLILSPKPPSPCPVRTVPRSKSLKFHAVRTIV